MEQAHIRERMKIMGSDRQLIGTVDRVEGDRIKISRSDSTAHGQHHYIPTDWVDRVDGDRVCLRQRAQEARQQWTSS